MMPPDSEYQTDRGLSFIPGEDYDPYDEDDVAAVRLAMEIDMAEQDRAEVERLKAQIAALQDYIDHLEGRHDDQG